MRKILTKHLENNQKLDEIINKVERKKITSISGLNFPAKELVTSILSEKLSQPTIIILNNTTQLLNFWEVIKELTEKKIDFLHLEEQSPYELLYSDIKAFHHNVKTLHALQEGKIDILLCTPKNLMSTFPEKEFYQNNYIYIEKKKEYAPYKLTNKLVEFGYKKVTMVSDPGEFSLRGDILDIYPVNDEPIRIEFWGDDIENIRYFKAETQRTLRYIEHAKILPRYKVIINEGKKELLKNNIASSFEEQIKNLDEEKQDVLTQTKDKIISSLEKDSYFEGIEYFAPYLENITSIFDYIPTNTLLILDESSEMFSKIDSNDKKYLNDYNSALQNGLNFRLNKLLHNGKKHIKEQLNSFQTLNFDSFISDFTEFSELLSCDIVQKFSANIESICEYVNKLRHKGHFVIISTQYPKRIQEILSYDDIPTVEEQDFNDYKDILVTSSNFNEGFSSEDLKLTILTDTELFNRKTKKSVITKESLNKEKPEFIENINDIKEGDYIVHLHHGIGIYTGLTQQELDGEIKDYLTLEYAKGDKLHIPAEQINFLSRYRGAGTGSPNLSRMGGADWEKTKSKVKKATEEVAKELLQLYAKRKKAEGILYEPDSPWQLEMEDAFPYTETPDQLFAIEETKADMEAPKVMDRLICGDVGFGKTEVAMRAVFKAILSGKQVAILAPTTILAQQHFITFCERFKPYPIKVELLSRFRTKKEQNETVKNLLTGECDLVIGTHRLLSKDIEFKKLGMIVVDEEHRFGVTHKEKLKQFKSELDVLTLSATPIPRTLYMSLSGIRDMSLINTPPVNRAPVKTYVGEYNLNYVKTAINHELEREGQVYFLYNKVQSIYQFAAELQKLVPHARIGVAHGQMKEKELEKAMYEFSTHQYDILLCTTIIESGLDIPNANTMIVYDADRFGLAQLYQIRGRVGRCERQAYAYCFYREGKVISDEARDRLKAIREFTTLGSGYQIAMRDLEIRGVGHILGHKQHGHMITVGFDTYCQLLEDAIKEVKGEKTEHEKLTTIDINITAFIPDEWVGDKEQKMIEYKRLADVKNLRELELIKEEWKDRFGKIPESVENLIKIIRTRILSTGIGINVIRETPMGIRIHTEYEQQEWRFMTKSLPKEILQKLSWVKAPLSSTDAKSFIMLNNTYLTPEEVFNILESLFYHINKLQNKLSEF